METGVIAALVACGIVLGGPIESRAQDRGPKVEKTYGEGLPRDRDRLIFADDQYPVWPLTPEQKRYASIDGTRMKSHVIDLAQVAVRYRDAGHTWWGACRGTASFSLREACARFLNSP